MPQRPLIAHLGKLSRRWHVVCARCTEWDIPSGTKAQAEATLIESGWREIAGRWTCRSCVATIELDIRRSITDV